MLQRILRRAHRVPEAARDRGLGGTALVQAVIARDGSVVQHRLLRSSGVALLDEEALALLRRVSPFPALPDSYAGAEARITVPVEFRILR